MEVEWKFQMTKERWRDFSKILNSSINCHLFDLEVIYEASYTVNINKKLVKSKNVEKY